MKRRPGRCWLFLALLLMLMMSACFPRPPAQMVPVWKPDRSDFWEQVSRVETPAPVIISRARMVLEEEGKRYVQQATLLWQSPDRLRIELSPPIGLPNLFITVSKTGMTVFLPSRNEAYVGAGTQGNISRFLLLDISLAELTAALIGKPPPLLPGEEPRQHEPEEGLIRFDIYRGDEKIRSHWFNPGNGHLVESEFLAAGEAAFRLNFTEFRRWGDILAPRKIEIRQLKPEKRTLTLQYADLQRGEPGREDYFRLILPEGVRELRLE